MPEEVNILNGLQEYGILGIMCIILLVTIGALWKRLNTIQDGRLQDMKDHNKIVVDLARDLDGTLNALKGVVEGIRRV